MVLLRFFGKKTLTLWPLSHSFYILMKLKLRKGLNLNLKGSIYSYELLELPAVSRCAIVPDDFPGFIPKVEVKEGGEVAVGSPLLYDKAHPDVKIISPIAGKVKAIVRGERRKILRVEVEAAEVSVETPRFTKPADRAAARAFLAKSGMLAFMRQRPYDIVPNPDDNVRDIFVMGCDFAPLAISAGISASYFFEREDFEAGVEIMSLITDGKIYFCYDKEWGEGELRNAENILVEGPYPASNAGVIIANIAPINKGDIVWTMDAMTLGRIGAMMRRGRTRTETTVAIVGPEIKRPRVVRTVIGAPMADVLKGFLGPADHHRRVISGNVLTGVAVDAEDGYLRYPYRQVTVIAEGDDVDEFMGWASLSRNKMSCSRSFPSHNSHEEFSPDARLLGGRRAMIMSGEYDAVTPMDIMPEYLIKAILSHNIEDMEKLGIYEVAPEDFAAAEYVDTSKLPLQQIVRDGLDYLRKELE